MIDDRQDELVSNGEIDAIVQAESSGFSTQTDEEIRLAVQDRLRNNGQL